MRSTRILTAATLLTVTACGSDPPLPDLTLDRDTLLTDISVETRVFAPTACEVSGVDECIGGPGERKLLRFSVATLNVGTADLVLGDPADSVSDFEFSGCHGHYHLADYATYELLAADGTSVGSGHKQAFCLRDSIPMEGAVEDTPLYTCSDQGLQMGWADLYDASVPCQWIDITDVADGEYELVVRVNATGRLDELDTGNNEVRTPVRIGSPALESPEEACDSSLNPDALAGMHRECGWTQTVQWDCAGAYFSAGCGAARCEQQLACAGDPMIRVCDATAPNCTTGASLGGAMSGCGTDCALLDWQVCPASGSVTAYTASVFDGDNYDCDVVFQYM